MLTTPYRGALVDLTASDGERVALAREAKELPSLRLSDRSLCDLELLATGAFSPVASFMGQGDYESVLRRMRLADGTLWPIPITLPAAADPDLRVGRRIALRTAAHDLVAVMTVEEIYPWDRAVEAGAVLGRADESHPLVSEMLRWPPLYVAGPMRVFTLPPHYDFTPLRRTPAAVRTSLERMGHPVVVAFQTRNPMHRSHEELTKRALADTGGALLLHPVVGPTRPGDVDHYTRVRTYRAVMERYYDPKRTLLALLPLAMRMAGPREALWHAIIRRNFGASHFIVGRDHASPGSDSKGKPFFEPYAAQELLAAHADEIGVRPLAYGEMVYLPDEDRYEDARRVGHGVVTRSISGTEARHEYLARGRRLPGWFTRPEVAAILAEGSPPRDQQGFCVWLTGLPAAGKSVTAEALTALLLERGRIVTLLDGDVVRTHLSKGLGYSREDRDANVERIGFVASEVVRHGGVAVCAVVSPYRAARDGCRELVGPDRFIEVFVDTPLEVCEARDPKGLYAKARRRDVQMVTGVDDPYEPPTSPVMVLRPDRSPAENARAIAKLLAERGFVIGDTGLRA